MLRTLSIRNFVIVDRLELEFGPGLTVLTGETGAGKSILLDALDLVLGERFETATVRSGSDRAELAAEFSTDDLPFLRAWLRDNDLAEESDTLLVRRVLDAQGRSRAYVNGHPVTLQQLREAAESLVDIHGQHAHQSLLRPEAQRQLLDSFGGFAVLARETAGAWRRWREALAARERSAAEASARAAEREALTARHEELARLNVTGAEWQDLQQRQRRLANLAELISAAESGHRTLAEDDAAVLRQLASVLSRLRAAAADDPVLNEAVDLLEPAEIQIDEAARFLRGYRQKIDVDPADLGLIEERLAAIHDLARKYRTRAEELPRLAADTAQRLAELAAQADDDALAREEEQARATFEQLAHALSSKRRYAATELSHRVTGALQALAMPGGSFGVAVEALPEPGAAGLERIEFRVSTHPQQPEGPLARVASGGELSRVSLAIQVVTSEVAEVPTLVFDEVDVGVGGAVAEVVGRLLQQLGAGRQVICVTHLAQVAACADHHYRVRKSDGADSIAARVERLDGPARVEELARMMGGLEITAATRAHARESLATSARLSTPVREPPSSRAARPRRSKP